MQLIKADVGSLTPEQLAEKCQYIEKSLTGNASFVNPVPKVTDLTAARTDLETAIQEALTGAHAAISVRNTAAANLRRMLVQEAQYVNSASAGDVDVALSSGFGPAKARTPIGPMPAPEALGAKLTDFTGRVSLEWKPVYGVKLYHVYMTTELTTSTKWDLVGVTTKARFEADSLESGTFYIFSVTAIGAAGEGARSDVARAMAA